MDRRQFTKLVATSGAAGLAGCLGGDDDGEYVRPIDSDQVPPEEYQDTLNVWNWYFGFRDWAVDAFADEYDVSSINTAGYSSATEWYSRLEAGQHEIDSVGSSPFWTNQTIENGYAEPLPVDRMPSWEGVPDMVKEFIKEHYERDGEIYAMPQTVTQYPTLTYNEDHFSSPPESWGVLWEDDLEDQVFMWDDAVIACQIAAFYTGQDPLDPDDYDEIEAVLEQQRPLNVTYWSDFNQARGMFTSEEVVAGPLLDGQTYTARFDDEAPINFTVPQEGSFIALDELMIPEGAPNPQTALLFLDWMCRPENIKMMLSESGYRPPIEGADLDDVYEEELDSGDVTQEQLDFLKWDERYEDRLEFLVPLDEEIQQRYDEIWTSVKA